MLWLYCSIIKVSWKALPLQKVPWHSIYFTCKLAAKLLRFGLGLLNAFQGNCEFITFQPQISNISEFGRLGASIWLWGCLMSIVISGRSTNSLAGMRTYVTRMGTSLTRDWIQWMQVKNNRSRKSSNQTRWNRHHLSRSWVNGPWSELYLGQSLMILHWAENQILGMSWVQQFSIWNCS